MIIEQDVDLGFRDLDLGLNRRPGRSSTLARGIPVREEKKTA
jgi:hypothetical protein